MRYDLQSACAVDDVDGFAVQLSAARSIEDRRIGLALPDLDSERRSLDDRSSGTMTSAVLAQAPLVVW
jgi:hypothetical protein